MRHATLWCRCSPGPEYSCDLWHEMAKPRPLVACKSTDTEGTPSRPGEGVDRARILLPRRATDANGRDIGCATSAGGMLWHVDLVLLLSSPPIGAGSLPAPAIRVEVPLSGRLPESERAVVSTPECRWQLLGSREPRWNQRRAGNSLKGDRPVRDLQRTTGRGRRSTTCHENSQSDCRNVHGRGAQEPPP
jgi:hypothetical protein